VDLISDISVTHRHVLSLRNLASGHHDPSLLPTLCPHRQPLPCVPTSPTP
jgi:hypothetical protein